MHTQKMVNNQVIWHYDIKHNCHDFKKFQFWLARNFDLAWHIAISRHDPFLNNQMVIIIYRYLNDDGWYIFLKY